MDGWVKWMGGLDGWNGEDGMELMGLMMWWNGVVDELWWICWWDDGVEGVDKMGSFKKSILLKKYLN